MPKFSNPKPARPSSITYDVGVYDDHTEVFWLNELIHREDGPAITKRAPEVDPETGHYKITEELYYFEGKQVNNLDTLLQLVKNKYGEK
jgi:hypothetical protein